MDGHLSKEDIEAYRGRTAPPERMLAIDDHLRECRECRRLLEPRDLRAACAAMNEAIFGALEEGEEHLDFDQLSGYIEGTLDRKDRKAVSAHIDHCLECYTDIQGMSALKAQLESDTGKKIGPTKRDRFARLLQPPVYRWALGTAALAVIMGVTIGIYGQRMQSRIRELESVAAQLEAERDTLKSQNAELRLRHPESTAIALKDRHRNIALNQHGALTGVDGLPAPLQASLMDALRSGRLSLPAAPSTSLGKIGTLLGGSAQRESFALIYPVGTAVEDVRPVLEWTPLPGATGYIVMLKDLSTGEEIEGPSVAKTTWKCDQPLVRGHQYAWMVEAAAGGRYIRAPAMDKSFPAFKVLDAAQLVELESVRKAWGDSHLVLGLTCARLGLAVEAEKEFRALVAANPESFTARSLLASVEAALSRGRAK